MVYYHPQRDIIAVSIGTFFTHSDILPLLEYNDEGCGVFVLTGEWIVVGSL